MAKEILMYIYPDQYPVLRQEEGKKIEIDKTLENQPLKINFLIEYYNKLNESFDGKYEKIISHNNDPKTKLKPIFWDHPEIKFEAKTC